MWRRNDLRLFCHLVLTACILIVYSFPRYETRINEPVRMERETQPAQVTHVQTFKPIVANVADAPGV
jgi:hypothetical protein